MKTMSLFEIVDFVLVCCWFSLAAPHVQPAPIQIQLLDIDDPDDGDEDDDDDDGEIVVKEVLSPNPLTRPSLSAIIEEHEEEGNDEDV